MKTPKFTSEAQLNLDETGINWTYDYRNLTELGWTPGEILEECLDGADQDRVQGWHDYVDALVEAM